MSVTIKLSDGTQKTVEVPDFAITVARFKEIAAAVINIPADQQRVVLRGRVLKDADVLSVIGMEDGQAVHIVRGQKSTKASAAPTTTPPLPEAQSVQANTNTGAGLESVNPYSALAANSTPESFSSQNTANFASGLPLSPEFMSQMMQNPLFMQLFQESMRNPQMHGQNLQQYMSNPAFLQLASQLMSNPAFLQQMTQSMGGGFASQNSPFVGQQGSQPPNFFQGGGFSQPPVDSRVLYQSQLQQLREMGFPNEEANIAALEQARGNIDFAIERLLNS